MNISKATKAVGIALVLAAAGTAGVAQARSNVYFSVGANVAPGVNIGVSNVYGPEYYAPYGSYVQPAYYPTYYPSTYYAPAPVYVRPAPVFGVNYYYGPSVYYRSGHRHHHRR